MLRINVKQLFSFIFVGVLFISSIINIFNFSVYDFLNSMIKKIKSVEFRKRKDILVDESLIIKSNEPIDISINDNQESEDLFQDNVSDDVLSIDKEEQIVNESNLNNEDSEVFSSPDFVTSDFSDDIRNHFKKLWKSFTQSAILFCWDH